MHIRTMKLSNFEQERLDFIVTDYKLGPALKSAIQELVESVKAEAYRAGWNAGGVGLKMP